MELKRANSKVFQQRSRVKSMRLKTIMKKIGLALRKLSKQLLIAMTKKTMKSQISLK